jgi:hypothetical protein
MSVAVLPMSKELGWTGFERGLVNSAFFYGYAATQIPAGWISTRCGQMNNLSRPSVIKHGNVHTPLSSISTRFDGIIQLTVSSFIQHVFATGSEGPRF